MNCFCIVPFTISTRPENICKIPAEHNQKMPSQSCGSPRLAPISGRSNKMCPGRGITLGLIIQNCHKAIATKKEWFILLQLSISRALGCSLQVTAVTAVLQSAISWDCDQTSSITWGIRRHHVTPAQASLTSNNATPLSPGLSSDNIHAILLNTIQTQSRSRH